VKDTPPLPSKNHFNVLAVEEIKNESSAPTDVSSVPETARTERTRKSKRLPKKLNIGAAEVGRNSLYLRVEIESTDNQQKYGVRALVDSGATGLFIDQEYVKSNQIPTTKLPQPILVFNVDGTANMEGSISEVVELLLRYNGHSERALFCVTGLGKQNLILGHTWLKDHNPEVDWRTSKVEMSRCSPRCCNGCRTEAREERRILKRETASINACRSGSFPATVEDVDEEEASDEPTASDIPFDIEDGDRVWATGLIPEAQYIQASSTISQRLAEGFARNTEAHPTLPTGGSGSGEPIPDYVKIFGQVFSEEGFAKLPNRKPWDHAIELVPGAQLKGCKVYLISVTEQSELDRFHGEPISKPNGTAPQECSQVCTVQRISLSGGIWESLLRM
jgi:predicted aspartyl protease